MEIWQNKEIRKSIRLLKTVAQSAIGRNGRLKLIQNNCGGHVTVTSCSKRILNSVKASKPVVKIITSAALHHVSSYQNDGLFLLSLTTELLDSLVLKLADVPQCTAIKICEKLNHALLSHLQNLTSSCSVKTEVKFKDISLLMSLMSTLLGSKPACAITDQNQNHIACLILKAWLDRIPTGGDSVLGNLHIISCSGLSSERSQLLPGVLVEITGSTNVKKIARTLTEPLKCALYHVSMSGDLDEDYETNFNCFADFDAVKTCCNQLLNVCKQMVDEGVDVVACQKVIHPTVKKYLIDHGIVTVDRLGFVAFDALLRLTNASPIESFTMPFDTKCCGLVDKLSIVDLQNNKNYLHFQTSSTFVYTLFLCNYHEESLAELKMVCQQCIASLRGLLAYPVLYCGGGCLEVHLAAFIRHWSIHNIEELVACGASIGQIRTLAEVYANSLERVALAILKNKADTDELFVDNKFYHLWTDFTGKSKCSCSLITKSDLPSDCEFEVLSCNSNSQSLSEGTAPWVENELTNSRHLVAVDCAASKLAAFKTSLELVTSLLSADIIINTNICQ